MFSLHGLIDQCFEEVLGSVLHPYVASLGEGDVQESESDMENEASSVRSTSRSGHLVVGRRGFQVRKGQRRRSALRQGEL